VCSIVLDSPRLVLRRVRPDDAKAVFGYRSDPRTQTCQLWAPDTQEEVEEFINHKVASSPNISGTWFQFAICLRTTGEVIGDCGLHFTEGDSEQVEIGITLSPAQHGLGYAAEAAGSVLKYVFVSLQKHRVFSSVDPENHASIKLLERLGMRREAHHIESVRFRGRWADDLIYAMLAREWQARNE
jgi:RimJ/RimL family protein N-acetyltransferase